MDLATHPYRSQIRLLLTTALVLFVFTVVIGILNGTDIVDFDRKVLLTHVHVGTLAWITLSVFASTLWLFATRPLDDWLGSWARVGAPIAAVTILAYDLAFLATTGWIRPAIGGLAALVIVVWFAWAVAMARTAPVSVPQWGLLAALATSVTGGDPRRPLRHPDRQPGRRQGPARRRRGRPPGDHGRRLPRARRPGPGRVLAPAGRGPHRGLPSRLLADGPAVPRRLHPDDRRPAGRRAAHHAQPPLRDRGHRDLPAPQPGLPALGRLGRGSALAVPGRGRPWPSSGTWGC